MTEQTFQDSFKLGSTKYTITASELRVSKAKSKESIPLTHFSPCYSYVRQIPLLRSIYALGIVLFISFLFYFNYPLKPTSPEQLLRITIFSFFVLSCIKNFKKYWAFYHHGEDPLIIEITRKNKSQAEQLVKALSSRISHAKPSCEDLVLLLNRYSLLTLNEFNQMQAKLSEQETEHPVITPLRKK